MSVMTLVLLALTAAAPPPPELELELTTYRIELSAARAAELDAALLSEAAFADFVERLNALGNTLLVYEMRETVAADGAERELEFPPRPQPAPASDRTTARPRSDREGRIRFSAEPGGEPGATVRGNVRIDVRLATDSSVRVGDGVSAPLFRRFQQVCGGAHAAGRPLVLVSLDGVSADPGGPATALVTRLVWQRR